MKNRAVRSTRRLPSHRSVLRMVAMMGLAVSPLHAGPLDPPSGPVTSTGKMLAELEPRVAINSSNTPGDSTCVHRITRPGSYYFTGNIIGEAGKNGLLIDLGPLGGHVSIDFNGFTLEGVPGSLDGITDNASGWTDNQSYDIDSSTGSGGLRGWDRIGIIVRSSVNISNIAGTVFTPCYLVAGSTHTAKLRNCRLHSTGGSALVTDPNVPIILENTIIEGDGCDTTSLMSLGGPTVMGCMQIIAVSHSVFSGPIIDITPTGSLVHTGGQGITLKAVSVSAASAMRVSAGSGAAFVEDRTYDDEFVSCTFSTSIIDIARDGTRLGRVVVHSDAATSAPMGLRLNAINCAIDEGLWFCSPGIPVGISVTGSNNTIRNTRVNGLGMGVRIAGASNTITGCRFCGSGAGSPLGVLITAGSTSNLVTSNEFVNLGGGAAVSNLGGATNGVAPILTPATLGTATNPLANIQH